MAAEVEEKEEICRCCLAGDREVISLQEETEIDGKRLSFMKLLSRYTRGVTFQPWQPPNICMECVQHLENAHRFNETCLQSQEYHKNKFLDDPRPKRTRNTAVKEKLPSRKPNKVKPKSADLKTSFVENIAIHKPPKYIKLKCEFCQKQFMSAEYLKMHTSKHKSDIYCNTCNIKYTNELQLNQHIDKVHFRKGHMCLLCLKLFKTVVGLGRHRLMTHHIQPKNMRLDDEDDDSDPTYLDPNRKATVRTEGEHDDDLTQVDEEKDADNERVMIIAKDASGKVVVIEDAMETKKRIVINEIPDDTAKSNAAKEMVRKVSSASPKIVVTGTKTRQRTIDSSEEATVKIKNMNGFPDIKDEADDGREESTVKELEVKAQEESEQEEFAEINPNEQDISETDEDFANYKTLFIVNNHTIDGNSEAHERMDAEDGVENSEHVLVECDVGIDNPSDMEDNHHGEVSNYEDVSFVEEQIVPEDSEQEEMVQYYVVEGDDEENLVEITQEQVELMVKGELLESQPEGEDTEEVSVANEVELESTDEQVPAAADNEEPSVGEATDDELEPGELPREVDAVDAMTSRAHGAYKCLLCAVSSRLRFNIARHLATAHHIKALVCIWCGEKFDKANLYIAHTRERCSLDKQEYKPAKNSRQDMDCPLCDVTCTSARQLTLHMRNLHKTKRVKECHICKKKFTSRSGFSKHMDAHSGMRRQRCTMCPRVLSNSAALRNHILGQHSHHRPHLCSECGRSFVSTDMLRKHHKLKHEGRRDFLCGVCGRTFQQASHVTQHMWVHTGVKPHVCRYCSSRYTSGSGLKKHYYRVHSAEYARDERKGDVRRRRLLRAGAKMPVTKESRALVSSQGA